jgi:acetoacetyl-CoA synthetase
MAISPNGRHGGIIIHGRSDATLNPGGVRIGTAEIYNQVEQMDEVSRRSASARTGTTMSASSCSSALPKAWRSTMTCKARIRAKIRTGASPRHVPAKIIAVSDIPRTKSGKIVELAVRDVVHGRPVKNKEALANPEALEDRCLRCSGDQLTKPNTAAVEERLK